MVSSLAQQLSKGVSLNAPLLADRSRRKRAESYLFTSREADQHDFHSIYALGVNGLSKLKTLDLRFAKYEETLFTDAARGLDRTLQSEKQNAELDRTLGLFLRDLGPYLLEAPTSKALEWVVRRFRVNEFNLDDVMALFLPYHESPHFAKMVSILHVKESRLWSFLSPLKAAGKPLPRSLLVEEMVISVDLARFATGLLSESLTARRTYRTLVGFTASVTVEYLGRIKRVEEEIMAFILPAATRSFAADSDMDCAMAGYISLATLSQHCRLSATAFVAVMAEMIKGQRHVQSEQVLSLLVAVAGPQDLLDEFPDSLTDSITQLPGVIDVFPDCLQWMGAEKLVLPMLPSLIRCADETACSEFMDALLLSSIVPSLIIDRFITLLLETILRSADHSGSAAFRMFSVIYQRHGALFSETTQRLLSAVEDNDDRETFEGVLRSVALPSSLSTGGDRGKWILSSNTADVSSRVIAVRELLKILAAGDVDSGGHEDLHNALRARVLDTNVTVIETLYSDPKAILPIISNAAFIESVSKALAAPDVSRSVMRLHFAFIAAEFCTYSPDLAPTVFERVFLPYILFTKPRQKTAALVWQSLRQSKLANYELLAGCMDIVFGQSTEEGVSRSVEEMATLDLALTSKIAGNTVASNAYPRHLDVLLGLLNGSDAHTIIVSYMLLRSLLIHLSGEHRVDAAHRMLTSMRLQSLDALHDVMSSAGTLQEVISEEALSKSVVLKPSSVGTRHRLQIAILALLPIVQQPIGVKIDWLGDGSSESSDTRGTHFMELARAIYSLANSSSVAQVLSTSILRALFVNLREQALLFLAGIWSTTPQSDMDGPTLPLASLFHGAAFLKAQAADTESPLDFQVILPSLLIALQSGQRPVRSAAMDCVAIVAQNSSTSTASPTIYALDTVYGNHSDGIQYLERSDFGRYVSSIHSRREHFINDGEYLGIFQQEMLCKERSDSKKEAGYKQRILCYTLSHAIVWSSLLARVSLLGALRNVPEGAKLQMLLPLIQNLISDTPTYSPSDDAHNWAMYCQLLLEAFDETVAPDLNEEGSGSWVTFMRLLRFAFVDGVPPSIRHTTVQQLRCGLFTLLTSDHQREICIILVESAATYPDSQSIIKEIMGVLLKDAALMTSLLTHFQPIGTDSSQRASKRVKLAPEPGTSSMESTLRPMTVLVEIMVANTLPGSAELMSCAVDALTRVFHSHSTQSDANYLMQLLMSMLGSIASSITASLSTAALPPGSVRMEILVELLRVADNPQTFSQALLLIASLARLAPEFVMQNVMPVFTFMGSNVFHRDDSYSFRVVQKTVESIVPVMIASLRAKHDALDLQIASREFLRVFTDAATHVPRHRRTQFFNHLVDVLGPDEFTVSICLLLVDKVANRVVRQKAGEAATALNLPLTILQANYKATPFKVVKQLLNESNRLLLRIIEPDSTAHDAFLELPQDGDQTSLTATKRQIQAILIFVDLVLQQSSRKGITTDENAVQESIRLLLELTNLGHAAASPEIPEVSRVALKALGHLLRVISATEFISAIATILGSSNPTVESGSMNLLASRLVNVTSKTRQDMSPTIIVITEHACDRLKTSQDLTILRPVLKALCAIAQTAVSKETAALTKAVPLVLQTGTNHKDLTAEVLACILPLSAKIGPRILPFFRDTVEFCSNVLVQAEATEDNRAEEDAKTILVALLSSLSQFWGIDELAQLVGLSLGARPVCMTLRKTLAKQTSAKQLLPALFRVWSELSTTNTGDWSRRESFFDLFKRIARGAPREDIHEHLRPIFKMFLDAFETTGRNTTQDVEALENASLAAFVEIVTKLNEAAFKPLFRRLFDWAFNDPTEKLPYRQVTFCRVLMALIKLLKGLITPYMGVALVPLTEALESFRANLRQSTRLWLSIIDLLQNSLALDEGAFWRTDKLRKLMPTLVAQVEVCPSLNDGDARQAFKKCLNALVATADDDSLLKEFNLAVLLQTRSDDAQVRLFALECAGQLWDGNGEKLMGFVSDVASFIAETADDEHDEVAKEARKLKKTIESRCGSLDVLMQ